MYRRDESHKTLYTTYGLHITMKQINLDITDEQKIKLKVYAAKHAKPMKTVIGEAIDSICIN